MRNYFSQLKKNNHSTSFVSKRKRYGFNGDWRTYKCVHQIKSQILNSESTNFFHEIFFLFFFQTAPPVSFPNENDMASMVTAGTNTDELSSADEDWVLQKVIYWRVLTTVWVRLDLCYKGAKRLWTTSFAYHLKWTRLLIKKL